MADGFVILIKIPTDPKISPQLQALREMIAKHCEYVPPPDTRIPIVATCGHPQDGIQGYVVTVGNDPTALSLCRDLMLPVETAEGVGGLGFELVKDDEVIETVTSDANIPPKGKGFSWQSEDLGLTIEFTA